MKGKLSSPRRESPVSPLVPFRPEQLLHCPHRLCSSGPSVWRFPTPSSSPAPAGVLGLSSVLTLLLGTAGPSGRLLTAHTLRASDATASPGATCGSDRAPPAPPGWADLLEQLAGPGAGHRFLGGWDEDKERPGRSQAEAGGGAQEAVPAEGRPHWCLHLAAL